MTQSKLKPCPFDCGGSLKDIEIESDFTDFNYVQCFYCGARGEPCGTKEQAIEAWNRRAKGEGV